MKEGKKATDVEKALQHWTGSVIEPQLKPVQAKARQLGETALSLASSLESRCREFIRNTKYDMSGLGDSRRLRAAMALNRVSGEIVTASGEFLKSSPNESISKLETSITRLLRTAGSSYNESVKAMASHYASERGWLRAEIEGLQRVYNQTSQFRTRTRDITSIRDQIRERSEILVEHLKTLQDLENSRVQLEKESHQLANNESSLLEAIERIESDSAIRTLNAKEAELKGLRKRLLNEEMSRLGGVFTKVLSSHQRGEVHTHPQAIEVLTRYVKIPLTTLAKESDGYPELIDLLEGLCESIESNKLPLGEKKARKTLERAKRIINGSLKPIQKEAREAFVARSQILRSPNVRKLRSQRSDLRTEYNRSRASKQSLESKIKSIAEEASLLKTQAKTHLDTIDELAMKNFNKGVPRELREEILSLTNETLRQT
jgi:chromosome segregation ATPase